MKNFSLRSPRLTIIGLMAFDLWIMAKEVENGNHDRAFIAFAVISVLLAANGIMAHLQAIIERMDEQ